MVTFRFTVTALKIDHHCSGLAIGLLRCTSVPLPTLSVLVHPPMGLDLRQWNLVRKKAFLSLSDLPGFSSTIRRHWWTVTLVAKALSQIWQGFKT